MLEEATNYLQNMPAANFALFACIAFMLSAIGLSWLGRYQAKPRSTAPSRLATWWGRRMDRKEHRQYVKEFTADKITSVLEDAVSNDDLSRKEVDNIYRQLESLLSNKNFKRGRLKPADDLEVNKKVPLKERILQRLQFSNYNPVKVPDPQPTVTELPTTVKVFNPNGAGVVDAPTLQPRKRLPL